MMRMASIALMTSFLLSVLVQPAGTQSDIRKQLKVPQPQRLFSIKHRVSFGEGGFSQASLFLVSQIRKYFYISFIKVNPSVMCYDRNGQLVSCFRVFSDGKEMYEERKSGNQLITTTQGVVYADLLKNDKIYFLIGKHVAKRYMGSEESDEEFSYRFLVFTPQGLIDKQETSKLNAMIEKLNKDINSKIIDKDNLHVNKVLINNEKILSC
jgi:hypothetical protein